MTTIHIAAPAGEAQVPLPAVKPQSRHAPKEINDTLGTERDDGVLTLLVGVFLPKGN